MWELLGYNYLKKRRVSNLFITVSNFQFPNGDVYIPTLKELKEAKLAAYYEKLQSKSQEKALWTLNRN